MRVQWQCKFWLATYLAGVLHKNTAAAASVTEPVTRQPTHCSDLGVSAAGIGRHVTTGSLKCGDYEETALYRGTDADSMTPRHHNSASLIGPRVTAECTTAHVVISCACARHSD